MVKVVKIVKVVEAVKMVRVVNWPCSPTARRERVVNVVKVVKVGKSCQSGHLAMCTSWREFVEYKTSMITDEDPLRGLLFCQDLGFFNTVHVPKKRRRRCEHPHLR